ncbi:putative polysaccharide biosynthesis protein [Filifactor villosus]|uniref:Oligosaccharide flippase family protein n=1 Tax=Filifactor villosus TaxID=29374 RepID=A0ABV9QMS7_9FIRM
MSQSEQKTFVKGAAILGLAGILVKVLGAVFKIPLVSIITSTGMGYYSSAYPIYVMLLAVATSGFPIAISKMVAERRAKGNVKGANRIFRTILPFMAVLGLVTSLGLFLFSEFVAEKMLHNPKAVHSLRALSVALFFVPIMSSYRGFFQGRNNMLPSALSQIAEQIGRVAIGLTLAALMVKRGLEYGAAGASMGATVGAVFGTLTVVLLYRREGQRMKEENLISAPGEREGSSQVIRELLSIAIPIIIGALVKPIMDLIDANMVIELLMKNGMSETQANSNLGQLSGMATTMVNLPSIVISAIAMSVVPVISYEYFQGGMEKARKNAVLAIRFAILIGLPAGIGLMSLSEPIMSLLFPKEASAAPGQILFIAAAGVVFLSLIQVLTAILQAIGKVYVPVFNLGIGVVLKIALTYVLTSNPQLGVKGAAIGTLVAYIVAAVLDFIAVKKLLRISFNFSEIILRPLVISVTMGLIAFSVQYAGRIVLVDNLGISSGAKLSTLIAMSVAGVFFVLMLFKAKVVTEEDLNSMGKGKRIVAVLKRLHLL